MQGKEREREERERKRQRQRKTVRRKVITQNSCFLKKRLGGLSSTEMRGRG